MRFLWSGIPSVCGSGWHCLGNDTAERVPQHNRKARLFRIVHKAYRVFRDHRRSHRAELRRALRLMARGGRKFPCDTCTVAETSIQQGARRPCSPEQCMPMQPARPDLTGPWTFSRSMCSSVASNSHRPQCQQGQADWPVDFFQELVRLGFGSSNSQFFFLRFAKS